MDEKVKQETLEFLWYSYFGISIKNAEKMYEKKLCENDRKNLVIICAKKAYLDMNRTLKFKSDERNNFCADICNVIAEEMEILLNSNPENFDKSHEAVCEKIIDKAKSKYVLKEEFHYGQASEVAEYDHKIYVAYGVLERQICKIGTGSSCTGGQVYY